MMLKQKERVARSEAGQEAMGFIVESEVDEPSVTESESELDDEMNYDKQAFRSDMADIVGSQRSGKSIKLASSNLGKRKERSKSLKMSSDSSSSSESDADRVDPLTG